MNYTDLKYYFEDLIKLRSELIKWRYYNNETGNIKLSKDIINGSSDRIKNFSIYNYVKLMNGKLIKPAIPFTDKLTNFDKYTLSGGNIIKKYSKNKKYNRNKKYTSKFRVTSLTKDSNLS